MNDTLLHKTGRLTTTIMARDTRKSNSGEITSTHTANSGTAALPFAIVWAVGLLFRINLITTGISMIEIAFGGRSASKEGRVPAGEPRGV